jgi:uncharacterized protein YbjT (DUF2867 family)
MKKILLVGATGQLGTSCFEKLAETDNQSIRIFVREDSQYNHLKSAKPEIFFGDLADNESIEKAVEGCDIIITTANSAAPRKKSDTFKAIDIDGNKRLIDAAKKFKIEQFIFTSVYPFKLLHSIPLGKSKIKTENYLKESGLRYTVLQSVGFMDTSFAFMGSTIPVKDEKAALVNRPWAFMQKFYNGIKHDVENGKIGIIGDGNTKHCYITIDNVADFLVKSINNPDMMNVIYPIGGPEALTSLEVKSIFEKVLGKELKVKRTPAGMMKIMGIVFSLFNEPVSNIFKINYATATESVVFDTKKLAEKLSITLTTAEEYLRKKANMS